MNATTATSLLLTSLNDFGLSILVILGAVLIIGIGVLIFHYGWDRLAHDQSLEIGGYYVRNLPYKGYKRFHSKKWNMEHMP